MPVVLARQAMRTRFELVLADDRDPGELRAAGEEALEEIARVEGDLSAFRPEAALFQVNAGAAAAPVRVDPALFRLLARAGELSARLGGAFDLTVGPLVRAWRSGPTRPRPEVIAEALAAVGFARQVHLDADAGTVAFARPGVRLDAGGLGKGYALARAGEILRDSGVGCALLHGGTSSVLALGAPPGAAGWRLAIEHPTRDGVHVGQVMLHDQALSVSTIFGRMTAEGGQRHGHVIDPRSGEPVDHTWLSAVVCADATDAEALSTALVVLGAEGLPLVEGGFPGAHALLAAPDEDSEHGVRLRLLGDAFH
jgi:thiamine biosynthesis lipoprotein